MSRSPLVSVIMSVYKPDIELFPLAINSILDQTYTNYEFIIIDDGNSESDSQFIKDICGDNRIEIHKNPQNLGLTKSLNLALSIARGKYVARHDADDISFPERFKKQVNFLEKNIDVGLLGTNYQVKINTNQILEYSVSHRNIIAQLMYKNPFCHSSVMLRRQTLALSGVYNEAYVRSQDFELWLRMIRTTKPAIIEEVLVMRHEYKGVALSTTSAAVSQFVNGVKLRLSYIVSEKSYSLLPYFLVGTTCHLWYLLKNVTYIKKKVTYIK